MCDTLEALFPKLQYTIQKFGVGEILYMLKKNDLKSLMFTQAAFIKYSKICNIVVILLF